MVERVGIDCSFGVKALTEHDIEARTRELYRLLTEDFVAVINHWLAEDFVWINHLPDHIPFGGVYNGAAGLGEYGQQLLAAIELKPLHISEIVVHGNTAVVIGVEQGTRVLSTGKHYDMDWVHVVKYADNGLLSYLREYNQYEAMAAAFRA